MFVAAATKLRLARYAAVMRWFLRDGLAAEFKRIAISVALELLGFGCKLASLMWLLAYLRRVQAKTSFDVLGHSFAADSPAAAVTAAALIALVFVLGALSTFVARKAAISAAERCSRRWLTIAGQTVRSMRAQFAGPRLVGVANLASQDALAAGRVVWQIIRGLSSVIIGIGLGIGMFWYEPWLTVVICSLAIPGLWLQYLASLRGARSTRELEGAVIRLRRAWLDEAGVGRGKASEPRFLAGCNEVLRLRSNQLCLTEESGFAASAVSSALLGLSILYFAWYSDHVKDHWELVVGYAIALRSIVGVIDANARRLVAVHRLYPNLARFHSIVVTGIIPALGQRIEHGITEDDERDYVPEVD